MCKACAMLWPMQILLPVSTIISCVISQGLSVIIITSSSVLYHILQANSSAFRLFASQSRQRRVYHPQLVAVYHQCKALYTIKPQVRCTLARDEIQGRNAPLMIYECISRCRRVIHSMIYQACGLDKQKRNFW